MALNDSFVGGGTQFIKSLEIIKLKIGECLVFSEQNKYNNLEVISGTRYIIKGFFKYRGYYWFL